jgi:hypothetical protein
MGTITTAEPIGISSCMKRDWISICANNIIVSLTLLTPFIFGPPTAFVIIGIFTAQLSSALLLSSKMIIVIVTVTLLFAIISATFLDWEMRNPELENGLQDNTVESINKWIHHGDTVS